MRGDLTTRSGRTLSAALLTVLTGLTLIVGAAVSAPAAVAPAGAPAAAEMAEVVLSPQQATRFTQLIAAEAARRWAPAPNGSKPRLRPQVHNQRRDHETAQWLSEVPGLRTSAVPKPC